LIPDSKTASIENDVYQMFTKIFMQLDDSDSRFFAAFGLSVRQYWALQYLDEGQGCSMVDLSRRLLTDKSNVTGIIDRLEHLKLARRTGAAQDRRVTLIVLTPEGRQLRDSIQELHDRRIRELVGVLDEDKLQDLLASLHTISRQVDAILAQDDSSQTP